MTCDLNTALCTSALRGNDGDSKLISQVRVTSQTTV